MAGVADPHQCGTGFEVGEGVDASRKVRSASGEPWPVSLRTRKEERSSAEHCIILEIPKSSQNLGRLVAKDLMRTHQLGAREESPLSEL